MELRVEPIQKLNDFIRNYVPMTCPRIPETNLGVPDKYRKRRNTQYEADRRKCELWQKVLKCQGGLCTASDGISGFFERYLKCRKHSDEEIPVLVPKMRADDGRMEACRSVPKINGWVPKMKGCLEEVTFWF